MVKLLQIRIIIELSRKKDLCIFSPEIKGVPVPTCSTYLLLSWFRSLFPSMIKLLERKKVFKRGCNCENACLFHGIATIPIIRNESTNWHSVERSVRWNYVETQKQLLLPGFTWSIQTTLVPTNFDDAEIFTNRAYVTYSKFPRTKKSIRHQNNSRNSMLLTPIHIKLRKILKTSYEITSKKHSIKF